jgi:hypothetical protein
LHSANQKYLDLNLQNQKHEYLSEVLDLLQKQQRKNNNNKKQQQQQQQQKHKRKKAVKVFV